MYEEWAKSEHPHRSTTLRFLGSKLDKWTSLELICEKFCLIKSSSVFNKSCLKLSKLSDLGKIRKNPVSRIFFPDFFHTFFILFMKLETPSLPKSPFLMLLITIKKVREKVRKNPENTRINIFDQIKNCSLTLREIGKLVLVYGEILAG